MNTTDNNANGDTNTTGANSNTAQVAPHEAIEVREFLSQEMLGVKKINLSMQMVKDQELKSFMQDSINSKKAALKEITSKLGTQNTAQ